MQDQKLRPEEMGDNVRNATLAKKELQTFVNSLLNSGEPEQPAAKEKDHPNDEQSAPSPPLFSMNWSIT